MFIYTLSDVIGLGLLALMAVGFAACWICVTVKALWKGRHGARGRSRTGKA